MRLLLNHPSACSSILMLLFFLSRPSPADDLPATNSPAQAAPAPAESAQDMISRATQDSTDGKLDQAIDEATYAIQLDPKNPSAYELRGSLYTEKKVWDAAERDYNKANEISPDVAYRYKLAEIKYLQKSYGDARFRFAALQADPRLGDVATYRVFLCDLFGGHETIAGQDLATIDRKTNTPAYFYANAAWCWFHQNRTEMNKYFAAAAKLYDESIRNLYISGLIEAQRFHPEITSFTTKNGNSYSKVAVFFESDGLRVSTQNGWITVPVEQLPDDLSSFPEDIRELVVRKRLAAPSTQTPVSGVSFTTKSGKKYEDVRWVLADNGVSVLGSDGWVTVPYDQLPDSLSAFPASAQQSIAENRKSAPANSPDAVISFTSKAGKRFDQVRASLSETGLRILSPDGWVEVPFDQIPNDISALPSNFQKAILERRQEGATSSVIGNVVSFTTKAGKQYEQVRASLTETGLRVLSQNGWIEVTFDQLPGDISPFPQDWWSQIRTGEQSGSTGDTSMAMVSFTTKKGKKFDDVRASMGTSGLRVLTSDGYIGVPYDQLPDDLSIFPPDWQEKITASRKNGSSSIPLAPSNE